MHGMLNVLSLAMKNVSFGLWSCKRKKKYHVHGMEVPAEAGLSDGHNLAKFLK